MNAPLRLVAGLCLVALPAGLGSSCTREASPPDAPRTAATGTESPTPKSADEPPPADAWKAGEPSTVHALLIGIANYHDDSSFSDLKGAVADAKLVRRVLVERFGADPARVHELHDADATLEGIVRAIHEHLATKARPGDEALLFYSGHGSRVFDNSLREYQVQDSSLVAHDSRIDGRRGSHDLTDDMLYSLLRPMTERGVHVTVITDACHSGGAVRGSFVARSAPPGETGVSRVDGWDFWPDGVPFLDDDDRPDHGALTNYVHISACAPDQLAYEYPFPQPVGPHGLLTWALADVLQNARPGDRYLDVARRIACRIRAVPAAPMQSVWVEGPDAERALFDRRFLPTPERYALRDRGAVGVVVDAGILHGLSEGAVLGVVDEDGREVGDVEIQGATLVQARGRWLGTKPDLVDGRALSGEVVDPPASLPRLAVHAAAPQLVSACASSQWADVVDDPARTYLLEEDGTAGVLLRTVEGIPIWRGELGAPAGAEASIELLDGAFRRETRFSALWGLADPDRRGELGELTLDLVEPEPRELRARVADPDSPLLYAPAPIEALGSRGGGRAAGEELAVELPTYEETVEWSANVPIAVLEVTNENFDETVYLHVLSINEAREITVLYPDPGVRDHQATMDSPTRRVRIEVGAMSSEGFPLERPMLERYLVIATRHPLELRGLEHRVETADTTRGGARSDLPGILRACLGGGTTRSAGTIELPEHGWGVAWVDVWISRR